MTDTTGRTRQVDLTLRLTEDDAERLQQVLDNKDWHPHLLTFLTPWRDKQVFGVIHVDAYQFGEVEDPRD